MKYIIPSLAIFPANRMTSSNLRSSFAIVFPSFIDTLLISFYLYITFSLHLIHITLFYTCISNIYKYIYNMAFSLIHNYIYNIYYGPITPNICFPL